MKVIQQTMKKNVKSSLNESKPNKTVTKDKTDAKSFLKTN